MERIMYKKLLQLPLFQGMGEDNLTALLEKVKITFCTYKSEDTIVEQGSVCDRLIFILSGSILSTSENEEQKYCLEEILESPTVLEPYSLYGMHTRFNATYKAKGTVNALSISKQYIISQLNKFEIFQLNYLNILSNRAQTVYQRLWNTNKKSIEGKIIQFLYLRCTNTPGEKTLHIKMMHLAELLDETRINVSKALNKLQEKGVLSLSRKTIIIPSMNTLLDALNE